MSTVECDREAGVVEYEGAGGRRLRVRAGPRRLARLQQLDERALEAAEAAVAAMRRYREHYINRRSQGNAYEGETANEVIERMLPDRDERERIAVLDVAIGMAEVAGVNLASRSTIPEYQKHT